MPRNPLSLLPRPCRIAACFLAAATVAGLSALGGPRAAGLEDELGRSEVRVKSGAYPLVAGRTVAESALTERLERLGYERVRARPEKPGRYFYGHERFWIYRRAHRLGGKDYAAALIGLALRPPEGTILGALGVNGKHYPLERAGILWLEPETLSESLEGDRAARQEIPMDELPEHVWRAVLAAEDTRFFEHSGLDAVAIARAALANVKQGRVAQGGSTITQQLIKNRDLTPKRSVGRKASEALRALTLEAEYDKREILQAYLNQVYLGHVDGTAIHGIGTASQVFFSKAASRLSLAEAALLAAIIQGPNRLSPTRHPERAVERRNWVLARMAEMEWADAAAVDQASDSAIGLRVSPPVRHGPTHFLAWVAQRTRRETPERIAAGRGVVVETTLDPYLQQLAEKVVGKQLDRLRRNERRLRESSLSAALVTLDASSGEVLAYVGGDPGASGDLFDRARLAERQPGSTVKPMILLEALQSCGDRKPLHVARRVADEPLRIDLESGPWEPRNADDRYRGVVDVRTALAESRNVPMVRIARWCGLEDVAKMFERSGLDLPPDPPPSFVLGSVETTPLRLAGAYTVLAGGGRGVEPQPVRRIEQPGGGLLVRLEPRRRRVVSPAVSYLVRDVMKTAVDHGTARVAHIDGLDVAAKTGSTSELRDAWFAGHAGSLVTVVWVGLDDGSRLGLAGSAAAGPIWQEFMADAVRARPPAKLSVPRNIVERPINPDTGLLVRERNRRSKKELFHRGALPRRDRFWRIDRAVPIVR